MDRIFLCLLCCVFSFVVLGQAIRLPLSSLPAVSAYSSVQADVFSFTANPASLPALKHFAAGIYSERRFMLEALGLQQAALALHTSSGNFVVSASYFGTKSYSESSASLGYAHTMGKADLGLGFGYHRFRSGYYEAHAAIAVDLGLRYHVTDQFQTGLHIDHPAGPGKEKQPAEYSMGFGYDPSSKFFIGALIRKWEDGSPAVDVVLYYVFHPQVSVRLGLASADPLFYFGWTFLLGGLRLDLSLSLHPQLGASPALSLRYEKMDAQ
jgi:hypothetical protein